MHSQRLNEPPLLSWVIAEKNRKVLCAHCTCMAGLEGACTHITALLFWVEMLIKIHNSKTVTDKQAYWVSPSNSGPFLQP